MAASSSTPVVTPKRQRGAAISSAPVSDDDDATPSRSFLQGLFSEGQANMESMVSKLDAHYTIKFSKLDKELVDIKAKADVVAQGQTDMRASIAKIEAALLLVETASRAGPPGSFARNDAATNTEPKTADPGLLRINTSSLVPFAELRARIDALCAAAQIEAADYDFSGPHTLGQRFSLAFRGEAGLAGRRARKVQQSLRNADGTWNRIQLTSPTGDPIEVYIGPDKLRSTLIKERGTKVLARILSASYPDITFTTVKRENGVAIDWALLVHVSVATGSRQSSLTWCAALAAQKGIVPADIDKQYQEHFAPPDATPMG